MRAAVVTSYNELPHYRTDFAAPTAGEGEVLVTVKAAALNQLTRGRAAGRHYSSGSAQLPFVPGVDGVGQLADGRRVYFALPTAPFGSMAEQTVVRASQCVPLPDDLDDVTAAAAGNPGMSSWAALTERARFVAGESVLINGATGVSGRLAIQIAKHLGARRVIATGRNAASVAGLSDLGADAVIALDQDPDALRKAFAQQINEGGVNVILDYLWGPAAEAILQSISGEGSGTAPRVRFVQIGSLAGNAISLPASILRSSGLELMGSGLGSVSPEDLIHGIGEFLKAIRPGGFSIAADPVPLEQVEEAWKNDTSAARTVFTL